MSSLKALEATAPYISGGEQVHPLRCHHCHPRWGQDPGEHKDAELTFFSSHPILTWQSLGSLSLQNVDKGTK